MKPVTFIKYIMIASAALPQLAGCSSESENPDNPDKRSMEIKVVAAPQNKATRALGASTTTGNELICSWWVAFVNTNGNVEMIATGNREKGVWEDNVNDILPSGRYTAYAFANISPAELEKSTGLKFEKGKPAPGIDQIKSATLLMTSLWGEGTTGKSDAAYRIPMSGYRTIIADGATGKSYRIEVVRMLSKIEFAFLNSTERDVVVKDISFSPVNTARIPLMTSNGTGSGINGPTIYEDSKEKVAAFSYTVNPEPNPELRITPYTGAVDSYGWDKRTHFYVPESTAEYHPTGHFSFTINFSRLKDDNSGYVDDRLYALTDGFTSFSRNDYLLIPIMITDSHPEISFNYYPPIGGYPAKIEQKGETEYYVTFGTGGRLEIRTEMTEGRTGQKLSLSKYEVTYEIKRATEGMLRGNTLNYDAGIHGFTGTLTGTSGTAEIEFRFTLKNQNDPKISSVRKVYLIKK